MTANSGNKYVLVLEIEPHRGPAPLLHAPSQVQILRVLAILLIVGLISLVITRHITSPIVRLRQVANQLAQGNLAARVGADSLRRKDELAGLSKDFDHMATQIQTLMCSQQRLLSDISHELRSPLARLSVALGIARRSATQETASALNRIERETQRLNELIGGLLQLARMESGAERLPRDIINLDLLLKEVAEDADFEARSRNRTVRVAVSTPCQVQGNPELLRSAIENVVRNAINYTPENTEVVATLTCEENNSDAVVRVRDQGSGVPESALANIFQPFYRVQAARDRSSGGTGLGLSITDRAIRGHGGSVQAQNVPGSGLQIELHLPVAHPHN
jgi:two-component system sensor histidine kinase CpxA